MKIAWDGFKIKRTAWMSIGIVFMGLGICLFKLSLTGNDPSSAFVMALGGKIGLPFSVMLIIVNCLWFVFEILFARKLIGIGTFMNWFGVGIFADLFLAMATTIAFEPTALSARLFTMLVGVLVLSFSCSLYQTADLGIAPYDALSLILTEKTPLPYFWCRIITDSACALLAFVMGGVVGLGTLVCAFGLGPFINFFTEAVAKKVLAQKATRDVMLPAA